MDFSRRRYPEGYRKRRFVDMVEVTTMYIQMAVDSVEVIDQYILSCIYFFVGLQRDVFAATGTVRVRVSQGNAPVSILRG